MEAAAGVVGSIITGTTMITTEKMKTTTILTGKPRGNGAAVKSTHVIFFPFLRASLCVAAF